MEITHLAEMQLAQQEQSELRTDPRSVLGAETLGLVSTLSLLAEHQKIGRLLVGDAAILDLNRAQGTVRTRPFLSTQPEFGEDETAEEKALAESAISNGFTFTLPCYYINPESRSNLLNIQEITFDTEKPSTFEISNWWRLKVATDKRGKLREVEFDSKNYTAERQIIKKQVVDKYRPDLPWIDLVPIEVIDNEKPEVQIDLFRAMHKPYVENDAVIWDVEGFEADLKAAKPILAKVENELSQLIELISLDGKMFTFPLGLIMHARRELQPKWRRK